MVFSALKSCPDCACGWRDVPSEKFKCPSAPTVFFILALMASNDELLVHEGWRTFRAKTVLSLPSHQNLQSQSHQLFILSQNHGIILIQQHRNQLFSTLHLLLSSVFRPMRKCTKRTAVVSDLVVGHMPPWKAYSTTHFPHVHFTAHIHLHCFQEESNPATNPHFLQTNPSFLLVHSAVNIPFLDSVFICPNSTSVSSWFLHPLPRLNPPCFSATRFLPSTTCANLSWMMLHITLYGTETKYIPWNSSILHTTPRVSYWSWLHWFVII